MPARSLGLAALLAVAALLAGCSSGVSTDIAEAPGGELTIYSSLPLQGPEAAESEQIIDGEKLALYQAGGRAGRYEVAYVSLDDAEPKAGAWSAGVTATNAKMAAQDTSTIAYLGDYNSGATAVSLPFVNAAGIPQVSPSSPYIGLTSSLDAGQDEPDRFYPSGKRTFARLQPGDSVEAAAQVSVMRSLGVHSVYVLDDEDPFEVPLASIVASDAQAAGIAVPAHDSIATSGSVYTEEIRKILRSGAEAVFLAGDGGAGTVALWHALHSAGPRLKLLGSSSMLLAPFTSSLGSAASSTYLTTPVLAARSYPPAAQRVLAACRKTFNREATPAALYGYEAMRIVLGAIRAAGARGDNRAAVTERLLRTRARDSVLGRYSITARGETTDTRYGVDEIVGSRAVSWRSFQLPATSVPAG